MPRDTEPLGNKVRGPDHIVHIGAMPLNTQVGACGNAVRPGDAANPQLRIRAQQMVPQ